MTEHEPMDLTEFAGALDRWGPDLDRWPPAAAGRARALLTGPQSADAAREVEAALALERMLANAPPDTVTPGLAQRITSNLSPAAQWPAWVTWLTSTRWRPARLALVPVLFGFAIGVAMPQSIDTSLSEELTWSALSDDYPSYAFVSSAFDANDLTPETSVEQ